jgi:dGTPase
VGKTRNLLYSTSDFERELDADERPEVGPEPYRTPARRDRARLIHSAAFRRLQGKRQLFPSADSDFFRNRLTHSLEVAQIAESIAYRLNDIIPFFRRNNIDPEVCATAALAHDLGHPPFGHNGERALDEAMKGFGGFEGNAQTFRIISRLEKKQARAALPYGVDDKGKDHRLGLNLSYRVLASTLKYDHKIPLVREPGSPLEKGYYDCDKDMVNRCKEHVIPNLPKTKYFKTVECQIMDIADDIAYSTYDLEDALKAGFLEPLGILTWDDTLLSGVAQTVSRTTGRRLTPETVWATLYSIFGQVLDTEEEPPLDFISAIEISEASKDLAKRGYLRTDFTADLISRFISGVKAKPDRNYPALSTIKLDEETLLRVEVLKHYNYQATIMSPRLKVAEHRGYQIVTNIFQNLSNERGYLLLPDDFREIFDRFRDTADKKRVICDFIAGMTDRYAVEFYGRLNSEQPQSIFKPL